MNEHQFKLLMISQKLEARELSMESLMNDSMVQWLHHESLSIVVIIRNCVNKLVEPSTCESNVKIDKADLKQESQWKRI